MSDDDDVSFLKELERENMALEQELKAIQDSYVEKAQKSFTNLTGSAQKNKFTQDKVSGAESNFGLEEISGDQPAGLSSVRLNFSQRPASSDNGNANGSGGQSKAPRPPTAPSARGADQHKRKQSVSGVTNIVLDKDTRVGNKSTTSRGQNSGRTGNHDTGKQVSSPP